MSLFNNLDPYSLLKEFISPLCPLSDLSLQALMPATEIHTLQRGDTLLAEGQIARYVSVVCEGLFRLYHHEGTKTHTLQFASKGDIIMPGQSLFTHEPSSRIIAAQIPSLCISFKYDELLQLSTQHPEIQQLVIKLHQNALLQQQAINEEQRISSTKERYRYFCHNHPTAAMYANVSHIASLLQMAPETLSRLRSTVLI